MSTTIDLSVAPEACPVCGQRDDVVPGLQFWAHDGEASEADYWECSACRSGGALVRADDPTLTINGIPRHPQIKHDFVIDPNRTIDMRCLRCGSTAYNLDVHLIPVAQEGR